MISGKGRRPRHSRLCVIDDSVEARPNLSRKENNDAARKLAHAHTHAADIG